jgi:hypothetical protein
MKRTLRILNFKIERAVMPVNKKVFIFPLELLQCILGKFKKGCPLQTLNSKPYTLSYTLRYLSSLYAAKHIMKA